MNRTLTPLAVALLLCAAAAAQPPVIRTGRTEPTLPQPQGVVPTPMLPGPWSGGMAPSPTDLCPH